MRETVETAHGQQRPARGVLHEGRDHRIHPGVVPGGARASRKAGDHGASRRTGRSREQALRHLDALRVTELDGTGPHLGKRFCHGEELVGRRGVRRQQAILEVHVAQVPLRGQPERSRADALAHDLLHLFDLLGSRDRRVGRLAHHVPPHGRESDERADVHAELAVDGLQVLRHRLPRPLDPSLQRLDGDGLDPRQHGDEVGALLGACGSESQRTVAVDDGRCAVVAGERAQGVPEHLRVVVAVVVDEPRGDDLPLNVDNPLRGRTEPAGLHDASVHDSHVSLVGGPAGAVHHSPVLEQQVVSHRRPPLESFRHRYVVQTADVRAEDLGACLRVQMAEVFGNHFP